MVDAADFRCHFCDKTATEMNLTKSMTEHIGDHEKVYKEMEVKERFLNRVMRDAYARSVVERNVGRFRRAMLSQMKQIPRLIPGVRDLDWIRKNCGPPDWDAIHTDIASDLYICASCLGGVALKAVQFVSQVADVREAYREIFSQAQEHAELVPLSSTSYVDHLVKSCLGLKIESKPFSVASVAQVHCGTLNGQQIVAKIQHENAAAVYLGDLNLMRKLGMEVDKYAEAKGAAEILDAIAAKLTNTVNIELNFSNEAATQLRVRSKLADMGVLARVPEVLHANEQILIMEYVGGAYQSGATVLTALRSHNVGGVGDRLRVEQREHLFDVVGRLLLLGGELQADAHPGNFMFGPDRTDLVLVDFGQWHAVSPAVQTKFREFCSRLPTTEGELSNSGVLTDLLAIVGVNAKPSEAPNFINTLLLGEGQNLFCRCNRIDPEMVPLLLALQYLSRFDRCASQFRSANSLEDSDDKFRLVRVLHRVLDVI